MIQAIEMDSFIKDLSKDYIKNPNMTIDDVYKKLRNYDIPNDEIGKDISPILDKINKKHLRFKKMATYYDRSNKFLRITSVPTFEGEKSIKLFLSIDDSYLENTLNKLIKFFKKNNIEVEAKVSRTVRSDGVVIRIANPSSAHKVIEFINNDKDIKKYSRRTNPFMLRKDIVGMAYDDMLSYNFALSSILLDYLRELKTNNSLESASSQSFSNYVKNYHNDIFINCSKITDISKNEYFKILKPEDYGHNGMGQIINNLEQITKLIRDVCDNKINLSGYYRFYHICKNSENSNAYIKYYNDLYYKKKGEESLKNYIKEKEEENLKNYTNEKESISMGYDILYKASIDTISNHDINQLRGALIYALEGDFRSFSGQANRDNLEKYFKDKPEKINEYCKYYLKTLGYNDVKINNSDFISMFSNELGKNVQKKQFQ